ncbi:MAG: T9SS type A sorting domain-containing protein [Omnitrophica WOR_2 bacterium]
MTKNYILIPLLSVMLLITTAVRSQVTITHWNFDQQTLVPDLGTGTALTIGGTTGSFFTGNPSLYSWSTTTYPAQGTSAGTAGVQFNVSTVGFNDIVVSWENRNSNTAANRIRLQYTLNGTDWLNFEATSTNATNVNDGTPVGFDAGRYIADATDWFMRSADFSGIAGVEQNTQFGVRLVTEFVDGTSYGPTNSTSVYATDGTIRVENVNFTGVPGFPPPSMTTVLLPAYMSGNTPANTRVPYAYRLSLNYLQPNTTYRYINTAVVSTDAPTSTGSGAIIFAKQNGSFTRTPVGSFTNAGEYGEFTTDINGNYSGWFITEPSTNTRFTPGNQVFMRIILNDGANGTTAAQYFTTTESVSVIGFSSGTNAVDGTGIRSESTGLPKNFVMLYDNVAGTGRPLFGTSIEATGVDFSTLSYALFYKNSVAGVPGSWGGIVPNVNANGVRLVEERALATGAIVNTDVSADGMWGTTNTVNPTGGTTDVLFLNLIPASQITVTPAELTEFSYLYGNGPSLSQAYTITASELVGTGNITITAPAHYELSTNDEDWFNSLELAYANGVISGQPISVNVRLKADLNAGNYNNEQVVNSGGNSPAVNVTCSGQVVPPAPFIATENVPEVIQGVNNLNAQRVPYAYYLTLNNLIPEATYHYYNRVVLDSDLPTADGAGNMIFVNSDGTFTRCDNPSMATSYGSFTANADGNYSGWFITESTDDARFTPGNQLYMRLMLNNGSNGTEVISCLTTEQFATVINFGTEGDPESGTGIRAESSSTAGNMIIMYDNPDGTGRAVYATSIETTGVNFTATSAYASFYTASVEGNEGAWGGIVPNLLPNGIRRIEERSITGTLITHWTSSDGVWGTVDTRNPNGGEENEIVLNLVPPAVPELTVNPATLSGFSYIAGFGPSDSQTYELSGTDLEGSGNIIVTAPEHYEISLDDATFTNVLELPFVDGTITGQPLTVYTRLKADLNAATYNDEQISHTGGNAASTFVTLSGTVEAQASPEITEVTLPQYIQGINGTNNTRVPFAFRATIQNLLPGSTYRFYNKAVVNTDAPDYSGVGNTIFANADRSFNRTTGTSLSTPGQYGEFTTDANGSYSGWFMLEPTGNDRFTPGNRLYMRIMLNDGNEGTSIEHIFTTTDWASVLMFETESDTTQGTSIRAISEELPGNFIFLYDVIGENPRPLYGTSIETTGIDFGLTGLYAPFYVNTVSGDNGSWGGIVPNVNANGIQMMRVYSNEDGSLVSTYQQPGGIWGITDTRNPSGGVDEVLYINLTIIGVKDITPAVARIWQHDGNINIVPSTTGNYNFTLIDLRGKQVASYEMNGNNVISAALPSGIYLARFSNNTGVYTTKLFIE